MSADNQWRFNRPRVKDTYVANAWPETEEEGAIETESTPN